MLGALLDGVPETAVLGLTLLRTGEFGAPSLVAVFVSNIPESIAATASLRSSGWTTARIYVLWSVIAVAWCAGGRGGLRLPRRASPTPLAFIDAFAAGAILTMLATSMMPEAFEHAGRAAGLATVFGTTVAFALDWA